MNGPHQLNDLKRTAGELIVTVTHKELREPYYLERKDVESWYRAKVSGRMADFCLTDLVETRQYSPDDKPLRYMSSVRLDTILNSYPRYLMPAFDAILNVSPPVIIEPALGGVIRCKKLTATDMKSLLLRVAKSPNPHYRIAALYYLPEFDELAFDAVLLPLVKAIGPRPLKPYGDCDERDVAAEMARSSNKMLWAEFDKALSRSAPALRAVLLDPQKFKGAKAVDESVLKLCLPVLRKHFSDTEVPPYVESAPMFVGFNSWTDDKDEPIPVGRLAVRSAARLLKIPFEGSDGWGQAEWDELRKTVESDIETLLHG